MHLILLWRQVNVKANPKRFYPYRTDDRYRDYRYSCSSSCSTVKRAKFAEVITAVAPYKTAVSECAGDINLTPIVGCGTTENVVPAGIANRGKVASLTVGTDGVITATATAEIDGIDFILTPTYTPASSVLTWAVTGSCVAEGYCKQ